MDSKIFQKGEIYLAYLNPKKGDEVGKLRPVIIYQTNMLNDIEHPTTTILPLSTVFIDETYPLRYRVKKRDNLERDSDILCDQIRTIDNQRFKPQMIAKLSLKEIFEIDELVKIVLGME